MKYKRLHITMPQEMYIELQELARLDHATHSLYMREALTLKMKLDKLAEHEVTDHDSLSNLVKNLHMQRISRKRVREMGPRTWDNVQG